MFGTDNFLPLTFYLTPPYRLPVTDVRFSMYGFNGTPSVMFDGTTSSVGGLGSGSMYTNYLPLYNARAATPSPLVVASSYTIAGDQATVTTGHGGPGHAGGHEPGAVLRGPGRPP